MYIYIYIYIYIKFRDIDRFFYVVSFNNISYANDLFAIELE